MNMVFLRSFLSLERNVSENWKRWIQQFPLYLSVNKKDNKPGMIQCLLLLKCDMVQAQELYNIITFDKGEMDKFELLIREFEDYCSSKKKKKTSIQNTCLQ